MGTMTSVTIIGISLIIIAIIVWFLGRKYNQTQERLKATVFKVNDLDNIVAHQGSMISNLIIDIDETKKKVKKDILDVKIGDVQASKLPLREASEPKQVTLPTTNQNDQSITMLTTATIVNSFDSTPSYSSGSCGSSSSSDLGGSDSSSSCSSSSDSY